MLTCQLSEDLVVTVQTAHYSQFPNFVQITNLTFFNTGIQIHIISRKKNWVFRYETHFLWFLQISWGFKRFLRISQHSLVFLRAPYYTVIQNANSHSKILFDVIWLCYDIFAYHQPQQTSRMSEKMKKANKGCKGQSKATQSPVANYCNFFAFSGSLDVVYSLI